MIHRAVRIDGTADAVTAADPAARDAVVTAKRAHLVNMVYIACCENSDERTEEKSLEDVSHTGGAYVDMVEEM